MFHPLNIHQRQCKKIENDVEGNASDNEEDKFLPDDEEDGNLSAEVKDLMRKLEQAGRRDDAKGENEEPTCTKVSE